VRAGHPYERVIGGDEIGGDEIGGDEIGGDEIGEN
jgi:hypothetical protein